MDDHAIVRSEISIAIVDDPTIRMLNKQYLDHDYETDVISFALDYQESTGELVGQLIVSTDTAQRMANEFGGNMQDELLLYVVHGTLHLVGYDDKDPSVVDEMRDAEKKYLAAFNVQHRWSKNESENENVIEKANKSLDGIARSNESDSSSDASSNQREVEF